MKVFVLVLTVVIAIAIILVLLFQGTKPPPVKKCKKKEHFLMLLCRVRGECKNMETAKLPGLETASLAGLEAFISHYLHQGVDKIILLDDGSIEKYHIEKYGDKVVIEKVTRARKGGNITADLKHMFDQIRLKTEWLIIVDADEFIYPRLNPNNTIRKELETTFHSADCILVPWVMFGSSGNIGEVNPIMDCVYRWNHDKRHPHPHNSHECRCRYDKIEVKSIFRPCKFNLICEHTPLNPIGKTKIVDSIRNKPHDLDIYYRNLRESDINVAILVCNRYHISSRKYMEKKCRPDSIVTDFTKMKHCIRDLMASDYNEIVDTFLRDREKCLFEANLPPGMEVSETMTTEVRSGIQDAKEAKEEIEDSIESKDATEFYGDYLSSTISDID